MNPSFTYFKELEIDQDETFTIDFLKKKMNRKCCFQ